MIRPATAPEQVLAQVLAPHPPPFALLRRPEAHGPDRLEVLVGTVSAAATLAEIPLPVDPTGPGQEVLALVPHRQLRERGLACVDDGAPLLVLTATEVAVLPAADVLGRIADVRVELRNGRFDLDDDAYTDLARRVVTAEIGTGQGSNFVLRRSYLADIAGYRLGSALALFRRLCARERGAYWTFIAHTGDRTFVGASPERHVSLLHGVAVMNPISGTYRYPPAGADLPGLLAFLDDGKEHDELRMVLDEELKMMARICDAGGRVHGPYLKGMARLAHTEYLIAGRTSRDPREVLRETMFAPAVTGSPLENACRVISRYEPAGRGYYGGAIARIGRDRLGGRRLDSAILIRTADIDAAGRLSVGVGATLVRHSDPAAEAAETRAKAAGLLTAFTRPDPGTPGTPGDPGGPGGPGASAALASGTGEGGAGRPGRLGELPEVRAALRRRNGGLSRFWLAGSAPEPVPTLVGRRVLVVDAEDTFTAMIGHQLRSLGLSVAVHRYDEDYDWAGHDLVVMGPGPGDPADLDHPRIARLYAAIDALLAQRRPFLAVCLSHQVLCRLLGLDLVRCEISNQGRQREIDLFGEPAVVGFYNTFAAYSPDDKIDCFGLGLVELSRDARTGEVHALRGPGFAAMQFHAESVLTQHGPALLATRITEVLGG